MGSIYRFIHAADLHLGSRFKGLSLKDMSLGERMRESTFESFGRIVDLAISEQADALVLSGDIYDDGDMSPTIRSWFCEQLRRLGEIRVFICKGNHDSEQSWDASIPYPENVHVFSSDPETIVLTDDIEITGVSYAGKHETKNLPSLLKGTKGRFTIACVHCDLDPSDPTYSYSPCTTQDLLNRDVDYWALGHIHKRRIVSQSPYIVYPGNTQGRSFKETGEKGAYLVEVSDGAVSSMRFVPTQSFAWYDLTIDVTDKTLNAVAEELVMGSKRGSMVRITFTGSGEMDSMVRKDDFLTMMSNRTGRNVVSVDIRTCPVVDLDSRKDSDDMTGFIIRSGLGLKDAPREEILDILRSEKRLADRIGIFEDMSDEELRSMVDRALRTILYRMGGSA